MAKRAEGENVKFDGISFRLNEKERRVLVKKAEDAGLTLSKYAKKQALEGKLKIMFSDEKAKEIITSLSRIGNNVNQIARKLNTENFVADDMKSQFTQIQSDLDIIMDFIILGKKPKKEKVKTTSEVMPTEQEQTNLFSSSPSEETEMKEKKCCDYCGAELLYKENKSTHKMVWVCAEYYRIVKNPDLLNATSTEDLQKHTLIEEQ